MPKDNRYSKIEGLLYSYSSLPYVKKNLEIDLELNKNEDKIMELEKVELTIAKIDNMLEMLKKDNEMDYLIIKLKYIDGLIWDQIALQLNMSVSQLLVRRRNIILNKLLIML